MTLLHRGLAFLIVFGCVPTMTRSLEADERSNLKRQFRTVVQPFLKTYCTGCHGGDKPKAKFDLTPYKSLENVVGDLGHWKLVLKRLGDKDMPPKEAKKLPGDRLRRRVVDWIERLRRHEAMKNAGDPGPVLARRLSNAEYNYAIRDLTGADLRPTRDFPVDPANKAGFDNTGESLSMSPALLKKYLEAARNVARHAVLLPKGIAFAPHPVVVYSDRDKYCVHRIVNFYKRQTTDYANYFFAAWRFRNRAKLGHPNATLAAVAKSQRVSPKYLTTIWKLLTDTKNNAGPISALRAQWNRLPAPDQTRINQSRDVRTACARMRAFVIAKRRGLRPSIGNYVFKPLHRSLQPLILWKDRDIAAIRRKGRLPKTDGTPETDRLRNAVARFCSVFPDRFYVSERGRMFESNLDNALDPDKQKTGRLLSAGFHLMLGYFRDDAPLYDLILDREQQQQLDRMWRELEYVTRAAKRQFSDFIYFERAESPAFLKGKEFDFAREDAVLTSQSKIKRLAKLYLAKARLRGIDDKVLKVIDAFFRRIAADIAQLEKGHIAAEPHHLRSLLTFAERAWQRPLTKADRDGITGFYRSLRAKVKLSHDRAVRDSLASILISPRFLYRAPLAKPGRKPQPLTDEELASRLSFFLWSSLPDAELRQRADAGDLHDPKVLIAQTRRMLKDARARRLAVEFGGNWLAFRRFETHKGVNRERFPQFNDALRYAMFEEPVRFFSDLIQRDASVMQLIEAKHTFVNKTLAKHYGIPFPRESSQEWVRIANVQRYRRGGLLPMAVFLTKNSPGLRTSPVKRGYWVVRRLLGEHIPPPPPEVPELPEDEAKLGARSVRDVLAKHRETASCAKCHSRFDAIGLAFEGFGPVGELRRKDLGGRPVDHSATFPDGSKGTGIAGLQSYLNKSRRKDFIDNLCRKLLSYGLGRSLMLSDEPTVEKMKKRLQAEKGRFGVLVETIVTSPQFLRSRGREYARKKP